MTGQQLYDFLIINLKHKQVIYISRNNGYHLFDTVMVNGNLRFRIPGNNYKYITQNQIINGRDIYNIQNKPLINRAWVVNNTNVTNDCSVKIFINLLKMPEYLKG